MESSRIAGGIALFLIACTAAFAQEDPEALYAKVHAATLAGNTAEVLGYGTAAAQAELAAKSQAEKDAVVRSLAAVIPKTYAITEKSVAPDGNRAELRGTGISAAPGRGELYLNASLRKEGETWKVATWSWSNQKPPPLPKPAAPAAPVAKDAASEEPSPGPQTIRLLTTTAVPAKAEPILAPPAATPAATPAPAPKNPSRAHLDARECLKLPTDKAIMNCAEKFR